MVHEVNSPAASVLSGEATLAKAVSRLRESARTDEVAAERMMGIVEQSAANVGTGVRRLTEIVNRLKRFSRLDAAELEQTDVDAAIRDTVGVVRGELGRDVRIELHLGAPPPVLCYASRLNQVYLDVIRNAAQAASAEGTVHVTTRAESLGAVEIVVTDDGPGIAPEELAHIFEPGFSAKGGRVRAGYGLATAFLVVRDHGGEIRVESARGEGTRVTIRLPREPVLTDDSAD